MSHELRIGIIGAGRIGERRATQLAGAKLVAVHDVDPARAQAVASAHGAKVYDKPEDLCNVHALDVVIVSTYHDTLARLARLALAKGKHVFMEKPGGRHPDEVSDLDAIAKQEGKVLGVGFNHRFHPALQAARDLVRGGTLGPFMYIRARYGHGGRLGYETEWRAKPEISGGGELIDQGVHLIDLTRWISGKEFELEAGRVFKFFWQMPVEDNGVLLLRSHDKKSSAFLHASCTEWKNLFDFEIFCQKGKIEVEGLGKSYGAETLKIYRMKPEMGPPDLEIKVFNGEDTSWEAEFSAFISEVRGGPATDVARASDAQHALRIVHDAYTQSGGLASL